MSEAMITTTIRKPVLLQEYRRSARKFGHQDVFAIPGDKKPLVAEWPDVFMQAREEHKPLVERFIEGLQVCRELPMRKEIPV